MTEQVQELINKIKSEGIAKAEEKAREIEQEAKAQAEKIVKDAQAQAEGIVSKAKEDQKRFEDSTRASLKQAARDTVLSLRKELTDILAKLVKEDVKQSLSSDNLARLINDIAKGLLNNETEPNDISVTVSKGGLKGLKDNYMAKLKEGIKQTITLRQADDITGGFTISFDGNKSSFDFTDESLAQYLGGYLNAEVAGLLTNKTQGI